MNYLDRIGLPLHLAGYWVTPIQPGQKAAFIKDWTKKRFDVAQCNIRSFDDHGVGVVCGVGREPIGCFDLDIDDAVLLEEMLDFLGVCLGDMEVRVGRAGRALVPFRQDVPRAGAGKLMLAWPAPPEGQPARPPVGIDCRGQGTQFVAYGRHPDGHDYAWRTQGLLHVKPRALPVLTLEQEQGLRDGLVEIAARHGIAPSRPGRSLNTTERTHDSRSSPEGGLDPTDDTFRDYVPRCGLSIEQAAAALFGLPADDYHTWILYGQALHHEFTGHTPRDPAIEAEAFEVWCEWSATSPKYREFIAEAGPVGMERKWAGFDRRSVAIMDGAQSARGGRGVSMRIVLAAKRDFLAARVESYYEEIGIARIPGERYIFELDYSQQGLAQRFTLSNTGDVFYLVDMGRWALWTGEQWDLRTSGQVLGEIIKTADALAYERVPVAETMGPERLKALEKFQGKCGASAFLKGALPFAEADALLWETRSSFDQANGAGRLLMTNGVLDLKTGRLEGFGLARELKLSRRLEYAYEPAARAPRWEQFLGEIFARAKDPAAVTAFVQRLVGYILLGEPREHLMVILYGIGANGKSTFMSALKETFGAFFGHIPSSELLTGRNDDGGAQPLKLSLIGQRLVMCTEPEEHNRLREAVIKGLTGGDTTSARNLYSDQYVEIVPTWTIMMPTNHKPRVIGTDEGIWRRLLLIPFARMFAPHEREPGLGTALAAERQGILNWCLEGARTYLDHGLALPPELEDERREYRLEMDYMGMWLIERAVYGADAKGAVTSVRAAFEDFQGWCSRSGIINHRSVFSFRLALIENYGVRNVTVGKEKRQVLENFYLLAQEIAV